MFHGNQTFYQSSGDQVYYCSISGLRVVLNRTVASDNRKIHIWFVYFSRSIVYSEIVEIFKPSNSTPCSFNKREIHARKTTCIHQNNGSPPKTP
jgi:hypothetical protein